MNTTTQIERLQVIINDPKSPKDQKDSAQRQLDRLSSVGQAQVLSATGTGSSDADVIRQLMNALTTAVQSQQKSVNSKDVRKIVIDEMKKNKIDLDDLSDSLRAFLSSTQKVQFVVQQLTGKQTTTTSTGEFLNRKLTQVILSDTLAKNNVYLYGSAGTGKTYVANQIAKLLGWRLITLNCNQYTSPLDIIGGQTTEGYQEGKLIQAWGNFIVNESKQKVAQEGCVLLLDELPKIDPNTAGILNEALAKVKDFSEDGGVIVPPSIENGKGEIISLGNLLVIATGNVPLNTIDPDYEANFKQDLSLQDRFIGSTYKILNNYRNEFDVIMKGYLFIWLFCVKLRDAIDKNKALSQAFVSVRLMINLRETYKVYRSVLEQKGSGINTSISKPKTLEDALNGVFRLFKDAPREAIMREIDYDKFKTTIMEKNNMPFGASYDTPDEIREGELIVSNWEKANKDSI